MADDPVYRLALQRAVRLSASVEVELTSKVRSEPLLVVLHTAREQAAEALTSLAEVDPTDANTIRSLQNEVARFKDLTRWLKQMLIDGFEAERELNDMQIEEARGLIIDDQDAAALGISNQGGHDD